MALVGGSGPHEGYVYALNPVTKIYGPVCDDLFTANAVSLKIFLFDCSLIMFYKIQLNEYLNYIKWFCLNLVWFIWIV